MNPYNPRAAAAVSFAITVIVGAVIANFAAQSDVSTDTVWIVFAAFAAAGFVAAAAAWAGSTLARLHWETYSSPPEE